MFDGKVAIVRADIMRAQSVKPVSQKSGFEPVKTLARESAKFGNGRSRKTLSKKGNSLNTLEELDVRTTMKGSGT